MLDVAKFKGLTPAHAEGRVRIDLTDPVTGKVKHRQEGKNHVFPDALVCGRRGEWIDMISAIQLELSDSTEVIDQNFPYMIGNTKGYGIPSQGSSGTYRGAYSVANQVLAAQNGVTSLRWKFQYDFTPGQANGTIGRVGLTNQSAAIGNQHPTRFPCYYQNPKTETYTCDGRYCYACSTAGIVTIIDMYTGATETIDISATTGTFSGTAKYVGYAPATGKMYIYAQSSTASNRKMYVFSNKTFSTLESTYSISNTVTSGSQYAMYIYGDYAFFFNSSSAITKISFVSNAAVTTITASATPFGTPSGLYSYTVPYGRFILSFGSGNLCAIFDMSQSAYCGVLTNPQYSSSTFGQLQMPLVSTFMAGVSNSGQLYVNPAIAMKKLDTPVTKTSANGMTVTYELEVFW